MIVCVRLLVHTLIVKCVCLELDLCPSRVSFIHASSFKYQEVPTSIICVVKSDGTRKEVLFEVLLSYVVILPDLVISKLLMKLRIPCM